ncbi:MAG: helicase-related protein [Nitrososphaerales archaeon]
MKYISHPFVKDSSLEYREYQVRLAFDALSQNTLISIPTGLGKTVIALLAMAESLKSRGSCLFLAPTRPLVHQHYKLLKSYLKYDEEEIVFVTGEERREHRIDKWERKVVCATPQVFKNDLDLGFIKPENFSLIIFDEAHRAVGDYAYVYIAKVFKDFPTRIMALTASLPSEKEKVNEILKNLNIERVEVRDESSEDVKPYVKETKIEWVKVDIPKFLFSLSQKLKEILKDKMKILRELNIIKEKANLRELLELRKNLKLLPKESRNTLFSCIRLYHALYLLETQGLSSFLNFLERSFKKVRSPATRELLRDKRIKEVYELARGYLMLGEEHPKLIKLKEILNLKDKEKAIIFASYRDTVERITEYLNNFGFKARKLIGKGGIDGLTQEDQINTLEELREGSFNILVATQVGEEGLDISECNLVVFYDNVPSAIRFIQRRGRTGRKSPGKMVIMLTRGTIDEAYYWIGKRRLIESKALVRSMKKRKDYKSLDQFFL